ncbi:unnamed protein product [Adineta ricciae]|uniref:Uncharacterized protein n=2 Tax=Adineta ricciae TaxID=249248 RepID=A0A815J0D0_ADIRI|nr:unnamed protein product [Adineta ricciae]
MANNTNYEYVNETSIEPEFICIVCSSPFIDPLRTPCHHSFCRRCITKWIFGGNSSCPICRKHIGSINSLAQATHSVKNFVEYLPVKCTLCETTNIRRRDFHEHIEKTCPKVHVSCSAADIKCPWKGTRDQLANHESKCTFEPLRSTLSELINENQQLKERINDQHDTIVQLMIQLSNYTNTSIECNNCRNCFYLEKDNRNTAGYYRAYANSQSTYENDGSLNLIVSVELCTCHCH